jgi:hypothetical protein
MTMSTHFIDHLVPLGYQDDNGFHFGVPEGAPWFLQGRVRGTRRPHKPTQLGSTPSPATISSIHGSRGYGMVARVFKGIWHARHFFSSKRPDGINRRAHRLGRLLAVSHHDWGFKLASLL